MTHIDTAEMYLSGTAEEWVAEAIRSRRDEVFLVSKVLPQNASRSGTIDACEGSLRRLQTDRLDCYLLHWRTDDYPLAETVAGFEQLQGDGKILSWGVSNFDVKDLEDLPSRPVCNQVLYYPQERAVEHRVIPWCERNDVAVVEYSPFGHDNFPAPQSQGGRVLQQIADELGGTPRQVALAFLLRWPNSFVIPKSSNPDHIAENAKELELSPEQTARIEEAFPLGRPPRHLPMI
jgi:diketogulonate reductase-like aldo/keto reductase